MRSRALHAVGITCGVKGTRRTTTNFADVTCERCRRLVTNRVHADVTAIREELASQRELIEGIERAKAFFAARKESMCLAVRPIDTGGEAGPILCAKPVGHTGSHRTGSGVDAIRWRQRA